MDPSKPNRLLLHVCERNGTPIRPLVQDVTLRHKFDRQGTPDVSADGSHVVFDAWPADLGFAWQESRVIMVNFDGTEAKDVCDGVMPSFSPDGKQIVVSRAAVFGEPDGAKGMSIWTLSVDGSAKKMIADRGAWGGRWSPDGKSIVFRGGRDEDGNAVPQNILRVYDLKSGETRNAFSEDESPFNEMSFHFEWSKHGRQVACTGTLKENGQPGLVVIDIDKGTKSIKIIKAEDENVRFISGSSIDWHPDDNQILVMSFVNGTVEPRSVAIDRGTLPVQITYKQENVMIVDACFSSDGESLIAAVRAR
ncbi:TolB family protein [Rubripirellula tenax]|uniref:TolB family protein n=1 Tax=Rubripirellula tenax TaxID=2528015 RepID=UPI0016494781|nr:PD40 domain-containing protein [Rubripirellula tenax]